MAPTFSAVTIPFRDQFERGSRVVGAARVAGDEPQVAEIETLGIHRNRNVGRERREHHDRPCRRGGRDRAAHRLRGAGTADDDVGAISEHAARVIGMKSNGPVASAMARRPAMKSLA